MIRPDQLALRFADWKMPTHENTLPPDFIVHDEFDSVGVVVIEDAHQGKELNGWVMASDVTVLVKALEEIPLGHKIALKDIRAGEQVIKYGHSIGRTTALVKKGSHVHVQNTKTEQW